MKKYKFQGAATDIVLMYLNTLHNSLVKHNATNCALDMSPDIYTILCKDCHKFDVGKTSQVFLGEKKK